MLFVIFQKACPTTFSKDYILKLLLLVSSSAKLHFDTEVVFLHLITAWWKPCRENSSLPLGLSENLWFCFRWVRKAAAGSPKPEEKSSSLHRKARLWLWQGTGNLLGAMKHTQLDWCAKLVTSKTEFPIAEHSCLVFGGAKHLQSPIPGILQSNKKLMLHVNILLRKEKYTSTFTPSHCTFLMEKVSL